MEGFTNFILRGRKEAIIAALFFTLVPYLSWFGQVIMALVTLRKGAKEGFWVLLGLILPGLLMAWLGTPAVLSYLGSIRVILYSILLPSILLWLFTSILHYSSSWRRVITVMLVLAVAAILGVHLLMPELSQWWRAQLLSYLQYLNRDLSSSLPDEQLQQVAEYTARVATGLQAVVVLTGVIINLIFARLWQALVFNPGGLGKELFALRASYIETAAFLLCLLAAWFDVAWVTDILPIFALLFIFYGLCLMHALIFKLHKKWLLLLLFYTLIVVLLPYMLLLLLILAIIDSGVNFRARFKAN